jgi:hypothetical protein
MLLFVILYQSLISHSAQMIFIIPKMNYLKNLFIFEKMQGNFGNIKISAII